MIKYKFPWPNEEKGYSLFPQNIEDNQNILFHGTPARNFDSIVNNGFKSTKECGEGTDSNFVLPSTSYAKNSNQSLSHVCERRSKNQDEEFVVFAVKFQSINQQGIRNNNIDIHVDDSNIQPEIIGYCCVPTDYEFK